MNIMPPIDDQETVRNGSLFSPRLVYFAKHPRVVSEIDPLWIAPVSLQSNPKRWWELASGSKGSGETTQQWFQPGQEPGFNQLGHQRSDWFQR